MTRVCHKVFFFFFNGNIVVNISFRCTPEVLSVTGLIGTVDDVSKLSNKIGMNHDFHVKEKVSSPSRYQLF